MSDFFVLRDMESGATVELAGVAFLVGRDPRCDICIDNRRVSRRHARLTIRGGELFLEDLHSANGTQVNGKPIRSGTRLDSGDVISVGTVNYLVIAPEAATGMTVVSSRMPRPAASFVEDHSDSGDTWFSQPYALPPGWTANAGDDGGARIDPEAAERQLAKQLLKQRVDTRELAAVLYALNGPLSGTLFALTRRHGGQWLLGRGHNCDPCIDDVTVSRQHALLRETAEGWQVIDNDTTNGVLINGEEVSPGASLQRGDILSLGDVQLLFRPF